MANPLMDVVDVLPFLRRQSVKRAQGRLRADGLRPAASPARELSRFEDVPPAEDERGLGSGEHTWVVHHPSPRAPESGPLRAMTWNIYMGGRRREQLLDYLARRERDGGLPPVLALQEANVESAFELGRRFGYHIAYYGAGGRDGRLVNGKALLSHFPLRESTHFTYAIPEHLRRDAVRRQGREGELVEDRGALHAALDWHGRTLHVFSVHHALGDAEMNRFNLVQLLSLASERRGGFVVVLGDFNANTSIRREGKWLPAQLRRYERTDSVEEYQSRYHDTWSSVGDRGVGNIGHRPLRRALRELAAELPEALRHAPEVRTFLPDGRVMSPEEARSKLNSGEVPADSDEWRLLQDVADAATLNSDPDERGRKPATGKHFDNVYASPSLEPVRVELDRSTNASDHIPITAIFRPRLS